MRYYGQADRCGISINELHDYGKAIQDDFNDDTILNVAIRLSNDINEVLGVSLQKATATTNQEMKNIKAEIKQLRAEQKAAQQAFHEFTTAAQTILEELKQLKSRQRSSPLKDRSRYTSPIRQCAMIENSSILPSAPDQSTKMTAESAPMMATSSIRAALFELHDIATPISIVFYNW